MKNVTAIRETFNLLAWFLDRAGLSGAREEEERAPLFEEMSSRGRIRLLDFVGVSKVLLVFLGPSGNPKRKEIHILREELPALRRHGVAVLAVLSADLEACRSFSEDNRLDLPVLTDEDGRLHRLYGADRRNSFLIGENGRILRVATGTLDLANICRSVGDTSP